MIESSPDDAYSISPGLIQHRYKVTMRILPMLLGLSLVITPSDFPAPRRAMAGGHAAGPQAAQAAKQLSAVRGEVVKIKSPSRGMLLITIRPAKDFAEVTVLARENDLVGNAVARAGATDLLGLLSEDSRDDETITAAELSEGDVVSVIYDPQSQNRALEIYSH
jgi:DNA-directed RNA polymerase subunit H (RpoH/RPB5)